MTFQVGDVVVCVDASPRPHSFVPMHQLLTEGARYTVSAVIDEPEPDLLSLRLVGVPVPDPMEGFNFRRFRKVETVDVWNPDHIHAPAPVA